MSIFCERAVLKKLLKFFWVKSRQTGCSCILFAEGWAAGFNKRWLEGQQGEKISDFLRCSQGWEVQRCGILEGNHRNIWNKSLWVSNTCSIAYVVYVFTAEPTVVQCLPWGINYPSGMERLWSQEAWMSEALPSSRKSHFFFFCFFCLCPSSLCEASPSLLGIKTKKKLVHKCNQTPACLTIYLAKHSRSASKLSPLRAPPLSQHCSIKLL